MSALLTPLNEGLADAGPADVSTSPSAATDEIFEAVVRRLAERPLPEATYRVQFNHCFTFRDAAELVPYLAALGVSDLYASPYVKACAGSMHGYDIVDHNALNPEIGTQAEYDEFVRELHFHGMGHVVDLVPNHMGVAGQDNAWWLDVLENGPGSPYAVFFDIDWMPLKPDLANKVLLPILGDQYGKILEDQQLVLGFEEGAFFIRYHERRFPIAARSWSLILKHRLEELERRLGGEDPSLQEYRSILFSIEHLPPRTESDPEKVAAGRRERDVIARRLNELCCASSPVRTFIAENVYLFNGRRGDPSSFDFLDRLLLDQAYRLAYWRVAADEINFRRFFDINELAAICMEQPEVFEGTHRLILRLMEEGKIDGLRIDHPDGLYDPPEYLRRLQQARFLQLCRAAARGLVHFSSNDGPPAPEASAKNGAPKNGHVSIVDAAPFPQNALEQGLLRRMALPGLADAKPKDANQALTRPLYVVVEKILEPGERLPEDWPIHGTTGYDFLNAVNGIFVDRNQAKAFDRLYARFIHRQFDFKELVYRCKKLILQASMSSELSVLGHQLDRISEQNRRSRDFTLNSLTSALREIIACFPVYRTYVTAAGVSERDRKYIERAVARARQRNPATSASIFNFVRDTLLVRISEGAGEESRTALLRFVGRFQQLTGPVMAKAVEDTACYIYNRLVSLNEVGGDPEEFGTTLEAFHQRNLQRQAHWPLGLLATSTHDTKRSEDVRARINVLSEIPAEWKGRLAHWCRWNRRHKREVDGEPAPSRNDEYLLYQTLIGVRPFEPMDGSARTAFIDRIREYTVKAAREAKVNTSWVSPNEPYEQAMTNFVGAILSDSGRNPFLADFEPFARRMADLGIWNSLSQTLLKLTCPGVPDIYQGTELFDFSLVDPDNRRPVDYSARRTLLDALAKDIDAAGNDSGKLAADLIARRGDGRIKLFLTRTLLNYRREHPGLFTTGEYLPMEPAGNRKEHLCAFIRRTQDAAVLVVVPRLVAGLLGSTAAPPIGPEVWGDTRLPLPEKLRNARLLNILTGELLAPSADESAGPQIATLLGTFPVAILEFLQ